MASMNALLCCFTRSSSPPPTQPTSPSTNTDNNTTNNHGYDYIPPPRYTPRPASTHEKTLEVPPHPTSPPPAADEKRRHEFSSNPPDRDSAASDTSSALSFQSSYGNTSTATRDTPPPPYTPRGQSLSPTRRARSVSGSSELSLGLAVPPLAHVAQPRVGGGGFEGRFGRAGGEDGRARWSR
jgi:hypothetical protein